MRGDAAHEGAMAAHGIAPIDLVVVNLYPFEATVAGGADFETCIETIDIGGPALIRAAAKNHGGVTVVVDPGDYQAVIAAMTAGGGATDGALRRRLAAKAYARTAAYDAAIATWFADRRGEAFPERMVFAGERVRLLRYGENPHQAAALYAGGAARPGAATARQLQGKALSFNNLNDTDAALELAAEFDRPAIAIVKHANPCGVAVAEDLLAAYGKALVCDPVSAFGGVIAANRPLDARSAEAIAALFRRGGHRPGSGRGGGPGPVGAEEPAAAGHGRHAGSGGAGHDDAHSGRGLPAAGPGRDGRGAGLEGGDATGADGRGAGGPQVRLHGLQARDVERHRLRQGRRHRGRGRGPDEPRGFRAHRRLEGGRDLPGGR